MRVETTPTHDVNSLFLRWEVIPEGKEKALLQALGGPLSVEFEVSCYIDLGGNRHETFALKVPIWPHPGDRNLGQARFWDVDSRRRFWVNLQGAIGTTVVDFVWDTPPGSVAKEGVVLKVPERPGKKSADATTPA
jgi:hypothetical protein